jgi:hypothetical protein
MVHASHERATLNEEVSATQSRDGGPEKLKEQLDRIGKRQRQDAEELQANRRVFPPVVGLSFLLGIFWGMRCPVSAAKKRPGAAEMISRRRFFQSAATGALTVLATARSLFAESAGGPGQSAACWWT